MSEEKIPSSGLKDFAAQVISESANSPPTVDAMGHEDRPEPVRAGGPWTDIDGVRFDPNHHLVTVKTGLPRLLDSGRFKVRPGHEIDDANLRANRKKELEQIVPQNPADLLKRKAAAKMVSGMVFSALMAMGGKSWGPQTEPLDEFPLLTDAFDEYFAAHGITKAPPEIGLAMAMGVILLAPNRIGGVVSRRGKRGGDANQNHEERITQ